MGIVSVEARERMVELQVLNIIDEETLPKPVECQLLNYIKLMVKYGLNSTDLNFPMC